VNKILVTGCAGFIGSHLTELLLNNGFQVIGIDNFDSFYSEKIKKNNLSVSLSKNNFQFYQFDVNDRKQLSEINNDIDVVIHLAAKTGVLPSLKNAAGYIKTNIEGTNSILDFIVEREIKKLIFASSSSVYGNTDNIPFVESQEVNHQISPYAFTKRSCELLNYFYHQQYNIDIINLRFFTVFGPRQRPDLAIHKFVRKILNDETLTVYGDGNTARDYTYVDDIVSGIFGAMNYLVSKKGIYDTFNIGNNQPVKLNELLDLLFSILNKKPKIQYVPLQQGDVNITYADISKAKAHFNYQPKTKFRDGLTEFINWYNEQNP
jgi:UDP-glucuronate 4-epimerase